MNDPQIKLLSDLVSIRSVYPEELEIGDYLHNLLSQNGFSLEKCFISDKRYSILAEKQGRGEPVGFLAHMDTVEPSNPELWNNDPFMLREEDDRLYGLGAYDMKGGMSAVLEATFSAPAHVKIAITADEENISQGAWTAVEKHEDFFKDTSLFISAEPNFSGSANTLHKERSGRSVYQVVFKGKGAHIANYKEGEDAIKHMGEFISQVYSKRDALHEKTGVVVQVRKVEGESGGITVVSESQIEVEALTTQSFGSQEVLEWLRGIDENAHVSLKPRKTPYLEGYHFDSFHFKDILENVVKKHTGESVVYAPRHSVADDNVIASLGVPVITWGPTGGNAHSPNEYVSLGSVKSLKNQYKDFLEEVSREG